MVARSGHGRVDVESPYLPQAYEQRLEPFHRARISGVSGGRRAVLRSGYCCRAIFTQGKYYGPATGVAGEDRKVFEDAHELLAQQPVFPPSTGYLALSVAEGRLLERGGLESAPRLRFTAQRAVRAPPPTWIAPKNKGKGRRTVEKKLIELRSFNAREEEITHLRGTRTSDIEESHRKRRAQARASPSGDRGSSSSSSQDCQTKEARRRRTTRIETNHPRSRRRLAPTRH